MGSYVFLYLLVFRRLKREREQAVDPREGIVFVGAEDGNVEKQLFKMSTAIGKLTFRRHEDGDVGTKTDLLPVLCRQNAIPLSDQIQAGVGAFRVFVPPTGVKRAGARLVHGDLKRFARVGKKNRHNKISIFKNRISIEKQGEKQ